MLPLQLNLSCPCTHCPLCVAVQTHSFTPLSSPTNPSSKSRSSPPPSPLHLHMTFPTRKWKQTSLSFRQSMTCCSYSRDLNANRIPLTISALRRLRGSWMWVCQTCVQSASSGSTEKVFTSKALLHAVTKSTRTILQWNCDTTIAKIFRHG